MRGLSRCVLWFLATAAACVGCYLIALVVVDGKKISLVGSTDKEVCAVAVVWGEKDSAASTDGACASSYRYLAIIWLAFGVQWLLAAAAYLFHRQKWSKLPTIIMAVPPPVRQLGGLKKVSGQGLAAVLAMASQIYSAGMAIALFFSKGEAHGCAQQSPLIYQLVRPVQSLLLPLGLIGRAGNDECTQHVRSHDPGLLHIDLLLRELYQTPSHWRICSRLIIRDHLLNLFPPRSAVQLKQCSCTC